MPKQDCVVAVFGTYAAASDARRDLEALGYGSYISIISRDTAERLDAAGPMTQGDEMEKSAAVGAATGATLGLLASSALLVIPGLGPVLFVGAIASGITGGIVGGLVGAMTGWGIKEDHAQDYEEELRRGKSLIVAKADPLHLAEIEEALEKSPAEEVKLHAESADAHVDA
ncbi:hypothetical protein [Lacipirellula parvula]|uniref:DUF1269 domain-containing protein n=1 Tax=Lacipirellula parvula TaxID=2650471 RepID=A0A5K7XIH0_9BACT|nr:hypothetical protein [Lacipirellula parvula]BBO35787.1 hypothetical protein PLANPX_5399 [Lacipirellula parvula]